MLASVADDRRSIAEATAGLGGGRAGAITVDAMRAAHAQADKFIDATSWSLDRSSPELLSAQLQRVIEGYASEAGAVVASSRTVGAQSDHSLAKLGLEFEMQATLPTLLALLLKIEQARRRIFVDRLTVQTAEDGGSAKGTDGQNELAVSLHVAIYAAHRRAMAAL